MSEENAEQQVDSESVTPLVDWKNAPTVADLKKDLQEASPSHKTQVGKIDRWLDNLNVEGAAKPKSPRGSSQVQPKLIRKQAEWRYPALSEPFLSSSDMFSVNPVTFEDVDAARQNALVLNHQFNTKIPKVDFIDEYVRTVVDEGTVIVRTGWDFEEKEVTEQQPIITLTPEPALMPLFEELTQFQQENPNHYERDVPEELREAHKAFLEDGVPYRPTVTGTQSVVVMKTVRNQPTLEVCSYKNVIIDPSCHGDLSKAGFVIYSYESSKSEMKKDGDKFKNIDKIQTTTNTVLAEPDHQPEGDGDANFNFNDDARKKFVVYEYHGYWDIDGTGEVQQIIAAWVGDTLVRMQKAPYPDGQLPFVKVQYLPVRKNNYGEPDGHLLEDNQKITGAVTRGMIDLLGKSANAQTGTRKGALDATNRRKFERGQDYEYNGNTHPEQSFYQHQYPEIPTSAQFMLQLQNMDAESMTGVKAFAGSGMSGDGLGETATGVRGVLDAASKREIGILRRLADGMVQIGRKIIAMNSELLDEEEVVRITNAEFVKVRRDDLAGNFDLELSVSTAEEDNAKAQELAFMLQTTGPNGDPGEVRMIRAEIARLRKMPALAKRIEEYQPQPDPLQQEKAQMEIQLLKAQIAETLSKAEENGAEAQLDMAKARAEIAKAANLQSTTDKNNLDFVEQESGVKQERELEKQGAQAEGNIKLEQTKAQLARDDDNRKELNSYMKNLR